jgi:predicted AAA+ superfamily ATPase
MNRETLKRVISDQKEELGFISSKHLIKREKLDYAKKMLSEPLVKVITGVRRSGKSTFCHQLLEGKNYSYFNFDDERLAGLSAEDLNVILEELLIENNKPDYLLFDEIQNVPSWELFINRLLRQNYNIIVTGSNGKMLSRELATHLTGRHYQIELYPFSFSEYLDYHKVNSHLNSIKSTKKIAEIKSFFGKYISEGGFPENMNLQFQKLYLRELFDKILIRDIVQRYEIRDLSSLKELGITLLNYFSSLFTYNKLKNSLNFKSVNTVKEYVH